MASYLYRAASTFYPCYLPVLGRFEGSWPYKTCRGKDTQVSMDRKVEFRFEMKWVLMKENIGFFDINN